MAKIQADQIEVGAGPQHSLPKYGPGPGWELQASRITDNGSAIGIPGRAINIGDATLNNGTSIVIDDETASAILAAGRNPNKNAKLTMQCEDMGQAVLSAKQGAHTASLSLKPDPTASSIISLGFSPVDVGEINVTARDVNLNITRNLNKNGVQLGVVYSDALVNQIGDTGPFPLTVDGASNVAGLFRISYYLVITTPGTSGTVKATFAWTDPATARSVDSATLTFGTLAAPVSGTLIVRNTAAFNITAATTIDSPVGDPEYALYITLERLQ